MGRSASRLDTKELEALTHDTYFERKEIKQWYKGFMRDNPSGNMDRAEFRKVYKQFFPFGNSLDFADLAFNVFDSNGDGVINFDEFIKALSITSRGSDEEKLQWVFKLYDIDGDNYITRDEMTKIVDAIYSMVSTMVDLPEEESTVEKRVDKIFETMDKNKDGKLTFEEFQEGAKKDPAILHALQLYNGLV
ncbi:neuronal calcium sensor 1b [Ramicandelaber brevisporus]|nr:neuronal calcium sensor 1b [Ramicandelaber brevisporus]